MLKKIKTTIALVIDTAAAVIMAALVMIVLWQVMSRYLMRTPSPWTEELAGFLMIWLAMVGATAALRRKAHLGIDILTTHLTGSRKMWVQIAASVCSGLFCLLVLCLGGSELVWKTLLTSQISPVMNIKMGYVYLVVPICGILMTIYCFEQLTEGIRNNTGEEAKNDI